MMRTPKVGASRSLLISTAGLAACPKTLTALEPSNRLVSDRIPELELTELSQQVMVKTGEQRDELFREAAV